MTHMSMSHESRVAALYSLRAFALGFDSPSPGGGISIKSHSPLSILLSAAHMLTCAGRETPGPGDSRHLRPPRRPRPLSPVPMSMAFSYFSAPHRSPVTVDGVAVSGVTSPSPSIGFGRLFEVHPPRCASAITVPVARRSASAFDLRRSTLHALRSPGS